MWRAQRAMAPAPIVAPVAPIVVPLPAPAPAAVAPAAPALAPSVEAAPAPRPAHHAHVAAPARVETAAPANRLAEETALLASANAELRRGDARRALSLLDDYDRRYPSGVLREEVLATRVIARCQLGPAPDKAARRGASAFLARHPASPLAPRVRSSCGDSARGRARKCATVRCAEEACARVERGLAGRRPGGDARPRRLQRPRRHLARRRDRERDGPLPLAHG